MSFTSVQDVFVPVDGVELLAPPAPPALFVVPPEPPPLFAPPPPAAPPVLLAPPPPPAPPALFVPPVPPDPPGPLEPPLGPVVLPGDELPPVLPFDPPLLAELPPELALEPPFPLLPLFDPPAPPLPDPALGGLRLQPTAEPKRITARAAQGEKPEGDCLIGESPSGDASRARSTVARDPPGVVLVLQS